MPDRKFSRRGFLYIVAGTTGLVALGLSDYLLRTPTDRKSTTTPLHTSVGSVASSRSAPRYDQFDPRDPLTFSNNLRLPALSGDIFGIIDSPSNVSIKVENRSVELVPGISTDLWVYEGIHGGNRVVNPIIKLKKEENFSASLTNGISQKTIIHWHGIIVDWKNDGHPLYAIEKGQTYNYNFTVSNRGGTYWYHPHPHLVSAEQVYRGLASFFIVEDSDEESLGKSLDLDLGATDIPLLIQDKRFHETGQLIYGPNPMERLMGFLGDMILVNLTPNPYLDIDTRLYRFRVLNGSTARIYRLAFVRGSERLRFHIVGVDAGLLEKPYEVREVFVAPAERVDILLDVGDLSPGDMVFLKSLEFDPMHMEESMMGGMGMMDGMGEMSDSRLEEGEEFYILKLVIKNKVKNGVQIPEKLSVIRPIDVSAAEERLIPLSLSMGMMKGGEHMMQWLIGGNTFDMHSYPIEVSRNKTEVWSIVNSEQSMPHPMHIHGYHFQVIERLNSPPQIRGLAVDAKGRIPTDLGWKDTTLVWPGETVRIVIDFSTGFLGEQIYNFHCHNLEHEDGGMMINYKVA